MPGLVRTVSKNEKAELIGEIRNLINDYLRNERCIILAIVPANVDFHNSQILADAKKVDPDTNRTIPVITKPDTIGEGSENSVLKLLLGEETDFALGFHMCKCRSQKELDDGLTLRQSLKKEEIYFNVTEPWRSTDNKNLFGVSNLSNKLATLQVQMIQDSMPAIISEIIAEKKRADDDLKKLGQETSDINAMRSIWERLKDNLITSMKGIYDGRSDANNKLSKVMADKDGYSWCSTLKKENGVLSNKILKEKLNNIAEQVQVHKRVLVADSGSEFEGTVVGVAYKDDKKFVHIVPVHDDDKQKCFEKDEQETKLDRSGYECNTYVNGYNIITALGEAQYKVRVHKSFEINTVRVSNEWLKKEIVKNKNQDLDCFLSCHVFKQIIHKLISEECAPICESFMKVSHDMLQKLSEKAVEVIFPDNWPRLKQLVLKLMTELVDTHFQDTLLELQGKLRQEETPYSQNDDLYETIKKKRNENLKHRILSVIGNMGDSCNSHSVQMIIESFFNQNEKMSVDDHNAFEMEIILTAYGKVASKRLIDDIPMISAAFFDGFFKTIRSALHVSDKDLEAIMKEPPNIANKRAILKKKIHDLSIAERAIDDFRMGY